MARRYANDWTWADIDDASGYAALGIVKALPRIEAAAAPRRYAFGAAQQEIIAGMFRPRTRAQTPVALPDEDWQSVQPLQPETDREWARALIAPYLSPMEQNIFLARLEGRTRGEIATRFDLDARTVHAILQRCRQRLARLQAA